MAVLCGVFALACATARPIAIEHAAQLAVVGEIVQGDDVLVFGTVLSRRLHGTEVRTLETEMGSIDIQFRKPEPAPPVLYLHGSGSVRLECRFDLEHHRAVGKMRLGSRVTISGRFARLETREGARTIVAHDCEPR